MRVWLIGVCLSAGVALGAWAQDGDWGNLDALILGSMPQQGEVQASFWMPDHADPTIAGAALALVYAHIPGSAGSVSLDAGVFFRTSAGWRFGRRVDGLFGHNPRDVLFLGDRIEVTMTTLGPNEPRCCPTQVTRYSILRTTGEVSRLP
jgi:hypothetical protein